jgi:hypothetical protein
MASLVPALAEVEAGVVAKAIGFKLDSFWLTIYIFFNPTRLRGDPIGPPIKNAHQGVQSQFFFYILKGLYMKSYNPEGEVYTKTYPSDTGLRKSELYKEKLCPSFV